MRDDLHANFRAVLQGQLARLDLVPREEFEAARDMLSHSRARLEELERQVAELEARDDNADTRP